VIIIKGLHYFANCVVSLKYDHVQAGEELKMNVVRGNLPQNIGKLTKL
jgi:hypothetical protein